jgi:hypothetical protein
MWALLLVGILAPAAPLLGEEYADSQTGLRFPDKLGEFSRVAVEEYKDKNFGVRVSYQLMSIARLDVYIYHAGHKQIGAGPDSEQVKSQYDQMKKGLYAVERAGLYSEVMLVSESQPALTTPAGELKFRQAYFTYKQNAQQAGGQTLMHSHAYLTGHKDRFLKLRVTYTGADQAQAEAAHKKLLADLGAIIK